MARTHERARTPGLWMAHVRIQYLSTLGYIVVAILSYAIFLLV